VLREVVEGTRYFASGPNRNYCLDMYRGRQPDV
jgi:hypothetical protein